MKLIKTLTLSTLLASSLLASDLTIDSIGLNIGVSHTPYDQTNNSGQIVLGNTPDQSFTFYELYTVLNPLTDMCKEKGMKPTLSYTYGSNNDLKHQYFLAGVNKYYHNSYAGLLIGYGELTWKYNPINSSINNDYTTTSPIIGIQTGYDYPITKNITLGINLKALYHNYDTKLNPFNTVTSQIEHDYTLGASVGIGYRF